jgi:hypothetical protein
MIFLFGSLSGFLPVGPTPRREESDPTQSAISGINITISPIKAQ